jgi:Phosphotransferase enzyme family
MTTGPRPPIGAHPPEPLSWFLHEPVVPGTNLRHGSAGGNLLLVSSSLEIGRIATIGDPPLGTVVMLRRLAGSVSPVVDGGPDVGRADVLWVTGNDGPTRFAGLPSNLVDRLVTEASTVIVEDASNDPGSLLEARLWALGKRVGPLDTLVIDGEVRAAAPEVSSADPEGRGMRLPGIGHPARRRSPLRRASPTRVSGRALLATGGDPVEPPEWLQRLAADHGRDLHGHRWSIAAPGVYDSQKVLVFLTPPGATEPDLIVKITRDARHEARLRNEVLALGELARLGPIRDMVVPGLVAAGRVGHLTAVIETIVAGRPFEAALAERDGTVTLERALDAIIGLAARSSHPVPGPTLAAVCARLLAQYAAIHEPTAEERTHLEGLVERVSRSAIPIPLVAQHGDPGTWNLLTHHDGTVGFLDWESFEPDGIPLWDTFRLLQSAVLVLPRSRLPRRRLWIMSDHFLNLGRYSGLILDNVRRYREQIGIAPELIEPLFTFCWIHRALKESARRRPDDVANGHYARFARRIVASPTSPTLRRLYGEGAST